MQKDIRRRRTKGERTEQSSSLLLLLQVEKRQSYPSATCPQCSPMLPLSQCKQVQEDRRQLMVLRDLHGVLDIPQTHLEE